MLLGATLALSEIMATYTVGVEMAMVKLAMVKLEAPNGKMYQPKPIH